MPNDPIGAALERLSARAPARIDLQLDRIEAVLETLGRPQDALPPAIHVAGTNGKGSTCAFIRAVAERAGLSVHVFSSPHLVRFNERVRLAGTLVSDARLLDALERVEAALGEGAITPFEANTAAALLLFSEAPADLLVMEVGLGGRYDATNVITPIVSVITPVDYDHKAYLGTDLAQIAGEKAGIIKPGVPVVSAVQAPVAADVIAAEAKRQNAPLTVLPKPRDPRLPATLGLSGRHQVRNASLAALALDTAMKAMGDPLLADNAVRDGAAQAEWPARMQRLAEGPLTARAGGAAVWLDGGHNPHAGRAIAELLQAEAENGGGRAWLVAGMMAAKDHGGFFQALAPVAEGVLTVPVPGTENGAAPEDLARAAERAGLRARASTSVGAALADLAAKGAARILICGSLYLAGAVLAENGEPPR